MQGFGARAAEGALQLDFHNAEGESNGVAGVSGAGRPRDGVPQGGNRKRAGDGTRHEDETNLGLTEQGYDERDRAASPGAGPALRRGRARFGACKSATED